MPISDREFRWPRSSKLLIAVLAIVTVVTTGHCRPVAASCRSGKSVGCSYQTRPSRRAPGLWLAVKGRRCFPACAFAPVSVNADVRLSHATVWGDWLRVVGRPACQRGLHGGTKRNPCLPAPVVDERNCRAAVVAGYYSFGSVA